MDDARALLDSLMGPSRDKGAKEQAKADGWKDKNVCKRYLVGFCPNNAQDNWFKNTRRDTGTCNKIHSDRLRTQFQEHAERKKYEPEYQQEFLRYLEGLVSEADAWIAREKRNCKPAGKEVRIPAQVKEQIKEMKERADQLMKDAEDFVEKNEVEKSKLAVQTATQLKEDVEGLQAKYTFQSTGEEVCDVCGVRCQPGEVADYQAHLDGKLHESYKRIREKVKELRESVKEAEEERAAERAKEREGRKDRDKDKDKERGGDRDRRDRDRRDRDRRDRDRSRSRDRRRR